MSERILRVLKDKGVAAVLYDRPLPRGAIIHVAPGMAARVIETREALYRHMEELTPISGHRTPEAWLAEEFRARGHVPGWVLVVEVMRE